MVTKLKYLGVTTPNLTQNSIYDVQSETTELYYILDDLSATISVLKSNLDFIPHWAISSLKELVDDSAFTKDSYETTFKIVSADNNRLRVDSEGRTVLETAQISYTSEYGGVIRTLALLTDHYRFSIAYTQDPTKEFATLQELVDYTSDQGWKLCYLADDSIVITDENGNTVIPEYVGINITF